MSVLGRVAKAAAALKMEAELAKMPEAVRALAKSDIEADISMRDRWWLRACVGALLLGVGTGAALYHTLDD